MELKARYKQTEVGVIPEDWEVQPIGNIATVTSGGTPSRQVAEYWDGDIPWATTTEVNSDTILETAQSITAIGLANSAAKLLAPGALLMALYGQGKTRGKVAILGIRASTNQACAAIVIAPTVSRMFVFHFLVNQYSAIRGLSNSGSQENLSGGIVKAILVPLPPTKVEQEAIAEALSDADALIESLDQLITKKRHLKQGAMQELLTGKRRLPGFSGEWEVRSLGEIAPLQRGFDLPNAKLKHGRYPVVTSNGILNHHINFQVKGPGVVTGRSGTIGVVTFVEEDFWPHNTSLWVTSFKSNDPKFVFYLYTQIGLERFATGSGVPTLNRNDVHAFKVSIPVTKSEQTAIATILSDMDTELAELESRLAKARQIKQGMMQELLTGRIRLL